MKQMVFLCLLSFISPLNLFFPPTLRVSLILPLFHPSLFPLLGPFFTVPIFKVSLVFSLFLLRRSGAKLFLIFVAKTVSTSSELQITQTHSSNSKSVHSSALEYLTTHRYND